MTKRVLAFDFGASSGRAIIGCFNGDKITLEEIAKQCGTINYEILSTISNRVVREIV